MFNIAIIEDEKAQSDLTQKLVSLWAYQSKIQVNIKCFSSAESFLFDYEGNDDYSGLLVDIQMDGISGIKLAKHLRETSDEIPIVFITGLSNYISAGYDVSALHYLLKPIKQEKLFACLDKIYRITSTIKKYIIIQSEDITKKLMQDDIISLESQKHSTIVTCKDQRYAAKIGINLLQESLAAHDFIKCHRSYIIGIKHINSIKKYEAIMTNKEVIPISRRLYNDVYNKFIQYHRKEDMP